MSGLAARNWLSQIPAAWEAVKLKYLVDFAGGATPDKSNATYWNGEIPWVSPKDMKNGFITDTEDHITEQGLRNSATRLIDAGAVLIVVRSGILQHTIPAAINRVPVSLNQDMRALSPRAQISSEYLRWLIKGCQAPLLTLWRKEGATVESLEYEFMSQTPLPVPPKSEQGRIVAFLDAKLGRLDELVRKKERQLALLAEKRHALISHAITRGLNHNAPTRPSGLPWLGSIPAHWIVSRLKYLARFRSGEAITSEEISEAGEYPVYGGNGLRGYCNRYTHDGDYVLIGRQGALCGNINYASGRFWASEHAVVATLRPRHSVFWFGELLRTMNLNQYSQSAAQPGLAVDRIQNLAVPVPPAEEQSALANLLKRNSQHAAALAGAIEKQLLSLREFRQALITALVTGQVAVPEEAVRVGQTSGLPVGGDSVSVAAASASKFTTSLQSKPEPAGRRPTPPTERVST